MDETKTRLFHVITHHHKTLYPRITDMAIIIQCKDSEKVTGKQIKQRMRSHLDYEGYDVKFVMGCYNARLKKDGRRVVPISPSLLRFHDIQGQRYLCTDVCDVNFHELRDEHILFSCRKPYVARFLTCDVIDVF